MPSPRRIQVLGLCRFSYPAGLGAFKTRHATMDARIADLWSDARMASRFFWFENVMLPCLRAQTDPDFTVLVLTGDGFPQPYLDRLRAAIADLPQVSLVSRPVGLKHRPLYREVMRAAREDTADVVAEVKMDDDDGVAMDFVARVRGDFETAAPLFARTGRLALDYQRGILLSTRPDGLAVEALLAQYWGAALVTCLRPGERRCTMDFPHRKMWRFMPSLTMQDSAMFIRGDHGRNDSGLSRENAPRVKGGQKALMNTLRRRFGLKPARIRRAWAGLGQS